jgi:hypothetical protein
MRFGYRCTFAGGHEAVEQYPIGHAPDFAPCSEHGLMGPRVFDVPYHVEDRRHMRGAPTANAPTEDWSWTLGAPRPKSRSEMRLIEKMKGIEFVSPAEAKADAAKLRAGKNLDEPVKPQKGWLAKEIAARGIRFDRSLTPPRPLTREESERKLAAERPDWKAAEAKDLAATKPTA